MRMSDKYLESFEEMMALERIDHREKKAHTRVEKKYKMERDNARRTKRNSWRLTD